MQHSRRRRGRILAGALAIGAILAGALTGSAQASAVSVGRSAATGQAVRVLASGNTSPHMIYPSTYVRVRVAGRNGASSIENIPIYRVTTPGFLSGIHACRALGNDGSTQGVMCADLFAERDNTGGVFVAAAAEGLCESLANGNVFPECAEIDMIFGVHSAALNFGDQNLEQCARHFGDPCSTPREIFEGPNKQIPGPCNTSAGGPNEVWTVITGGSSIELPVSGRATFLAQDLGSQHAIVCGAL